MISFIDSFMNPPIQFMNLIVSYIRNAALVAGYGINLSDYVSWVGLLGSAWVKVLNSILASFTLVLIIFVSQKVYRMYLSFKAGIKWW